MILFLKTHPIDQAATPGTAVADLNDGEIRRNPGEPSPEAAKADRYKKPVIKWRGLTIRIENPAGSVRRGHNWETRMKYDYGYISGSNGVDGDEVDVYLGPYLDTAEMVYVVHQRKYGQWSKYDEDKCMVGFLSEDDAKAAYLAHYDDPRFLGPVTALTVDEFVSKVKATKHRGKMIKSMVLFLKASVKGHTRRMSSGKVVYVNPYSNKVAGKHQDNSDKQLSLFADNDYVEPKQADENPEAKLRVLWTKQGVSREKQDELIAQVGDKAKPGAQVGPFVVGDDRAKNNPKTMETISDEDYKQAESEAKQNAEKQPNHEKVVPDEPINPSGIKRAWYLLGKEVVFNLPSEASALRPTQAEYAHVAKKLGISAEEAKRALYAYNDPEHFSKDRMPKVSNPDVLATILNQKPKQSNEAVNLDGKNAEIQPKEGERNVDGLVFRNGRWHRDEDEFAPLDKLRAKVAELGGKEKIARLFQQNKAQADSLINRFVEELGLSRDEVLVEFESKAGDQGKVVQADTSVPNEKEWHTEAKRLISEINKIDSKLERLHTTSTSRAHATSRSARSGNLAKVRDGNQKVLSSLVRSARSSGEELPKWIPRNIIEMSDYDKRGNYSPV